MNKIKVGDKIKYTPERWAELLHHFSPVPDNCFIVKSADSEFIAVDHSENSNLGANLHSYVHSCVLIKKPTIIII